MIDGTLGMGYGVSSATFLIAVGLYPAIVSASVHAAEIVVSFTSGLSHLKLGNIRKDILLPLAIWGSVGAIIGAAGVVNLPAKIVKPIVCTVLFSMGIIILYRYLFRYTHKTRFRTYPYSSYKVGILGIFGGFIDALGGGGWGPICTPALIIKNEEPRIAVGTVNLAEFFVTLTTTIAFIILLGPERFRWDLVLILMVFGVIAAPIAAFLCKRLPHRILGIAIGILIILLNSKTIILSLIKFSK